MPTRQSAGSATPGCARSTATATRTRRSPTGGTRARSRRPRISGAFARKGNLLVLFDKPGFGKFARTEFLGVKTSIWLMIAAVIVIGWLLDATASGGYMYAAGGHAEAARLARGPRPR